MCSGAATTFGYNKRTQIRSTTTAACMPVLKTNSVQGFLVSGNREKRVPWEAEELMALLLVRPSNPGSGLKVSRPRAALKAWDYRGSRSP